MSKRIIYLTDSLTSSSFYSYLCLNMPKDLMGEFVSKVKDLESFELFYFNHKDDVYLKSFFADKTLIYFLLFFSSLFKEDGEALTILNKILENIYVAHPINHNRIVVSELKEEDLRLYLEEILREIRSLEDACRYRLEGKCNDLINELTNKDQWDYTTIERAQRVLLSLATRQIVQVLQDWENEESDIEVYKNLNWTYDLLEEGFENSNWQWSPIGREFEFFGEILSSISQILYKSCYAYNDFSKDEKNDFMNLWILLVLSGYKSILPLSFFEALKRMLPNTF